MCSSNSVAWLLLLFTCTSYLAGSVEATNYITLDCDVLGTKECQRLQSISSSNALPKADTESLQSTSTQTTGVIIAIIIGSLTACIIVVVGIVVWVRKRKQRLNVKRQKEEQMNIVNETMVSDEWEASTVNTRESMLSDKMLESYPHEEEVLFRLDVLDNCFTPPSADLPNESHKIG